jgi:hypothetical protein
MFGEQSWEFQAECQVTQHLLNPKTKKKEENTNREKDKWTAFTLNNDKVFKWWNLISSQKESRQDDGGDLSGSDVLMEVNKRRLKEHFVVWHMKEIENASAYKW